VAGENDPLKAKWNRITLADRPVIHAIEVRAVDHVRGRSVVLTADNLGVAMIGETMVSEGHYHRPIRIGARNLVSGGPGAAPKQGCSEVHMGRLRDGQHILTTIEPWHGTQVVVYTEEGRHPSAFGRRTVIDDTLADGHALWVADVDGDGDDEVFAGYRGKDHRVSMYDFDPHAQTWKKSVIDREIAAQDLRGGDLDGDSIPDVVAVGGSTHNVVWYTPRRH
jgi:hypothetical protein